MWSVGISPKTLKHILNVNFHKRSSLELGPRVTNRGRGLHWSFLVQRWEVKCPFPSRLSSWPRLHPHGGQCGQARPVCLCTSTGFAAVSSPTGDTEHGSEGRETTLLFQCDCWWGAWSTWPPKGLVTGCAVNLPPIAITQITTTNKHEKKWNLAEIAKNVAERHEVSKRYWKNGARGLAQCRVATNLNL